MTVRSKAELLAAITPLVPESWTDTQLTDLIESIDAGRPAGGLGPALDANDIAFMPTNAGDWTTSPTTLQEALDELGAR